MYKFAPVALTLKRQANKWLSRISRTDFSLLAFKICAGSRKNFQHYVK
jgi:hypothetical protein